MSRAVPVLLAAILVVASAGTVLGVSPPGTDAAAATTPVEGISANTTDVLMLDTVGASAFSQADLVVTAAIGAQSGGLADTYKRYQVQAAFDAAPTVAAKRTVLRNASDWAEAKTTDLLDTERSAREAYIAGRLTAAGYLETLGRLQVRAASVQSTVKAIDSLQSRIDADLGTDTLLARLETLQGPVRQRLAAAIQGDGSSGRTFVAVSDTGVVLSQIRGGTYVRETVRTDNRDDAIGQMGFDAAEKRFSELYPWASSHKQRISMGALGPDVYVVELTHTHGTVQAALDASTGQVFREVQTKTLAATPADPSLTTTDNNTTVSISRAYAGGPLKVTVTNETDAPLSATVTVNGTAVGTTDSTGTLWTISPAGEFNVTAETDTARIRVLVTPTEGDVQPPGESPTPSEG